MNFSEALSTTTFHWTIARVQHHLDMLTSDKKNVVQWQKRLHIAVQVLNKIYSIFIVSSIVLNFSCLIQLKGFQRIAFEFSCTTKNAR